MANSYIGIATQRGLRRLIPEDRCLADRVFEDEPYWPRAVNLCFWVVLPDIAALLALRLLDQGQPLSALRTVNQHAQQLGRISAGVGRSEPTVPVAS